MLRLGTQTASMTNHLYSREHESATPPAIGTGATLLHWTDRTACTVTTILEGGIVRVQADHAKALHSGFTDCQTWEHSPNPNGATQHFRYDPKRKEWRAVQLNERGRWVLGNGSHVVFGVRDHFYDPGF